MACERCPLRVDCLIDGKVCKVLQVFMHYFADNQMHETVNNRDRTHAKFFLLALQRLGELIGYDYFAQDFVGAHGGEGHLHAWKGILPEIDWIEPNELDACMNWYDVK